MLVLGVDPGFASLGLVVLDLQRTTTRIVHHETFTTRATEADGDRIDSIAERLLDLLEQYEIDAVGYESQSWVDVAARERALRQRETDEGGDGIGLNASARRLHEVVGCIRCAARCFRLPVYCLMPKTVKCAVLGRGGSRAPKGVVKDRVRLIFGLGRCSEHVADAAAVAVGTGVRHRRHVATLGVHADLIH